MVNLPSWAYVFVVAVGGVLVVLGNIGFPIAREQEKRARLSGDAWSIIRPELEDNRGIALDTLRELGTSETSWLKLRSSSWEAVSNGGMLLSFDSQDALNLMRAYAKVYQINDLYTEYLDYKVGAKSLLTNRNVVMPILEYQLKSLLQDLQQAVNLALLPSQTSP